MSSQTRAHAKVEQALSQPNPKIGAICQWQDISTAPEGVKVRVKIDDERGLRHEQTMVRRGRRWFSGDMYVYYRPTHWMPAPPTDDAGKESK